MQWALVALVPLLLYLPTLWFGFVWDDMPYVRDNPWIRDASHLRKLVASIEGNASVTVAPQAVFWRPLRNLSYLADHRVAGLAPGWYHFVNVLWHVVACLGVRALAARLGVPPLGATLGALVFAVHPVQTESVAWIKERDGLMAVAFSVWCLWAALGKGWASATASMVLGLAAYLSKENAIVIPALLVAARWCGLSRRPPGEFMPLLSALGMLAVGFMLVRGEIVGMTAQREGWPGGTLPVTMWTMAEMFARYVGHVLLPLRLEMDYSHLRPNGVGAPLSWLGVALGGGMLAAAARLRRRVPAVAFGILAFLIALAPFSNLVPMMQWMAVRFLYMPMVGAAIAAGWGLGFLWETRERTGQLIGGSVVAGLAVLTLTVLPAWSDENSIWTNAYLLNSSNSRVRLSYAQAMVRIGTPEGIERARAALEGKPGDPPMRTDWEQYWVLRGRIIQLQEGIPAARAFMEKEQARYASYPPGLIALGYLRMQTGDPDGAEEAWLRALAIDPFSEAAKANLEDLRANRGS
jgi:hypothetical protein